MTKNEAYVKGMSDKRNRNEFNPPKKKELKESYGRGYRDGMTLYEMHEASESFSRSIQSNT